MIFSWLVDGGGLEPPAAPAPPVPVFPGCHQCAVARACPLVDLNHLEPLGRFFGLVPASRRGGCQVSPQRSRLDHAAFRPQLAGGPSLSGRHGIYAVLASLL